MDVEKSGAAVGSAETSPGDVTGVVLDIAHFSTHDGPGIRTVVFLKGCPLRCAWCHSPDSQRLEPELVFLANKCIGCYRCVDICPRGARLQVDGAVQTDRTRCDDCGLCAEACPPQALQIRGHRATARQVVDEVVRDAVFFHKSGGGVTLSGGEVLMQPAFSRAILGLCREAGVATAVETSGFSSPGVFQRLVPFVDLFLFDLKHTEPARHQELCGQTNDLVLANLRYLASEGREVVVRYPVIPGCNEDVENVLAMAALLRRLGLRKVDLLPYNPATGARYRWLERAYPLENVQPPTPERLTEIARMLGI